MARDIEGNELNQMLSVVKKYYELGMNQEQIAKEEFISKSSVCRLIKKANENGYVTFKINYPMESVQALEEEFYGRFDLDKVFITPTYTEDYDIRLKDTCKSLLSELTKIVQSQDILCLSWGSTLEQLANVTAAEGPAGKKCARVVLMNGSTAGDIYSTRSSQIVDQFSQYFSARGYLMPVPLIVDSKEAAEILKVDSHIKYVMDYVQQSQLAVMSIGALTQESVLRKRGAYSQEEYDQVVSEGAVGDIAGRCFDIEGRQVNEEIAARLLGPTLAEIRSKKMRIGIAVGSHKARAIVGALRGGIVNRLYTDELTAQEAVDILNGKR